MPDMKKSVNEIISAVPSSMTDPLVLRGGAVNATLSFAADISTSTLAEVMSNAYTAFRQIRKAQRENMRKKMMKEEEPPVPEEEAPVEAF